MLVCIFGASHTISGSFHADDCSESCGNWKYVAYLFLKCVASSQNSCCTIPSADVYLSLDSRSIMIDCILYHCVLITGV